MDEERIESTLPQDEYEQRPPSSREYIPIPPGAKANFFDQIKTQCGEDLLNAQDQDLNENLLPAIYRNTEGPTPFLVRSYYSYGNEKILREAQALDGFDHMFELTASLQFTENSIRLEQMSDLSRSGGSSREATLEFSQNNSDFKFTLKLIKSKIQPKSEDEGADDESIITGQDVDFLSSDPNPKRFTIDTLELKYKNGQLYRAINNSQAANSSVQSWPFGEHELRTMSTDPEKPDDYGVGSTRYRKGGYVYVTTNQEAYGDQLPLLTFKVPERVDIDGIIDTLFPDQEPIPEKDVASLREMLGRHDVPYKRPILFAHPEIARSDFPKDMTDRRIDLDQAWRSVDLADLIGVEMTRGEPGPKIPDMFDTDPPPKKEGFRKKLSRFLGRRPK